LNAKKNKTLILFNTIKIKIQREKERERERRKEEEIVMLPVGKPSFASSLVV